MAVVVVDSSYRLPRERPAGRLLGQLGLGQLLGHVDQVLIGPPILKAAEIAVEGDVSSDLSCSCGSNDSANILVKSS